MNKSKYSITDQVADCELMYHQLKLITVGQSILACHLFTKADLNLFPQISRWGFSWCGHKFELLKSGPCPWHLTYSKCFWVFLTSFRTEPFKPCQEFAGSFFNSEWSMENETHVVLWLLVARDKSQLQSSSCWLNSTQQLLTKLTASSTTMLLKVICCLNNAIIHGDLSLPRCLLALIMLVKSWPSPQVDDQ